MIKVEVDYRRKLFILHTDSQAVKGLLEFRYKKASYVPWLKRWDKLEILEKLYENQKARWKGGIISLEVGFGWAAYLINVFRDSLSQEDYNKIMGTIYSDSYREFPFPGLRDYQNQDVLHILKYNRAILQTNTSYGKTQVISTLANYAHSGLGKKVLIVTPGSKARDEVVKRYKTLFGEDISTTLDGDLSCIITTGFLNQKKIKDPSLRTLEEDKLRKYDWLLVDEVEYTINPSGKWIYDRLEGVDKMYAFSGTADKQTGRMITFAEGITENVVANKDLIRYFGPSLVYRMPTNLTINNITIKTKALNQLEITEDDVAADSNIYLEILTKIWTFDPICKLIVKIARNYPMLFIPINNLNNVIYEWINQYFLPSGLRTLLICGEGYLYFNPGEDSNPEKLDLSTACEYIKDGKVDIIPSTSSGYRALDFPGLENILLVQGVCAGVTLQCIGRVARGKHMNIIALEPVKRKRIPVYSKGFVHRTEMIKEYYKYCEITNITIEEDELS